MDNKDDSKNFTMLDEKLLNYIKMEIDKGHSLDGIRSALVKSGWHPEKVDHHIKHLSKKTNKIEFIILFFIIFLIIAVFFYTIIKINIKPEVPKSILEADFLCRENEYDRSIEIFKEYLLHNKPSSEIYTYLGLCFARRNQNADAILYLNKAIGLSPNDPHLYYKLAQLQCKIKDFSAAKANFNKAIELDPENLLFSQKRECASKKSLSNGTAIE